MLAVVVALVMVTSSASAEWKEKVLYSFQGLPNDGSYPAGGVVFDHAGNLYGATTDGGANNCPGIAQCGTVFQLQAPAQKGGAWTENLLYVFKGVNSNDGNTPVGGVIFDQAGNLYGTTAYGGTGKCVLFGGRVGCGTVYVLMPPKQKGGKWTEKILHSFQSGKDGYFPWGDLTFDSKGNLYGATQYGGGYGSCNAPYYQYCGTVFKLSPPKTKGGKWKEKVLYSFKSGKDGANPNGSLVLDSTGAIYGTTMWGGSGTKCENAGCGTAFRLTATTKTSAVWSETILHVFTGGSDGLGPNGGLVLRFNDVLYGTAGGGGTHSRGLVFELAATNSGRWTEKPVYAFDGGSDGDDPSCCLTSDSMGNFYGTAFGGLPGRGTVFELKPRDGDESWVFSLNYAFRGSPDAAYPRAGLVFGASGSAYSTTQGGGTSKSCSGGCGTIFETGP
jgi:hypothetical protein